MMVLFTKPFPIYLSHQVKSKPYTTAPSKPHCSVLPKVAPLFQIGPLNTVPSLVLLFPAYAYTFVHVFLSASYALIHPKPVWPSCIPFYFKYSLRSPQVFSLTHQNACTVTLWRYLGIIAVSIDTSLLSSTQLWAPPSRPHGSCSSC